ncbi:Holliday junction branch migration protein RuvA [Alicyclobacillus fastidiosus]|uniref:Holliday junction branch migration complex subunit RuvA n=1 Tax=Alicyclobacillus fastidiosus TaxID=392011 RepID=A0ABY6ZNF9_9BACL|nr:Holliday junction branch migration protein RuvA [Alicyclobacillus fastidiosus]WAH43634.1 Holliday junction branch migration protein RuvA [Alicyclobacillus fastidiosus]GMA59830.1 Holliday junction ATP-dependent DNA helicase RuvA [Alicyclobacillus fastidiosus]
MIVFLTGRVADTGTGYVDLDVQHVGYRVFTTDDTALGLELEQEIKLYTYQHVREDAVLLFGFLRRIERTVFEKLISVSGIGPKVALQMLGGLSPEALVAAIRLEDANTLCRLPGIGKKTAMRMILELKDKLDDLPVSSHEVVTGIEPEQPSESVADDVTTALMALGYRQKEAQRAVDAVLENRPAATVETAVKAALQWLYEHQSDASLV